MKLTINQKDLERIQNKLAKASEATSHEWKWVANLRLIYAKKVMEAMGSVTAAGAPVRIHFLDSEQSYYWKNLSPSTLEKYEIERRGRSGAPRLKTGAAVAEHYSYNNLKWEFQIWKHTGEVASHVSADAEYHFAGIKGGTEAARIANILEHGLDNEQGRPVPARPLFMVANLLLKEAVHKMLASPNMARRALVNEFMSVIGWGVAVPKTGADALSEGRQVIPISDSNIDKVGTGQSESVYTHSYNPTDIRGLWNDNR